MVCIGDACDVKLRIRSILEYEARYVRAVSVVVRLFCVTFGATSDKVFVGSVAWFRGMPSFRDIRVLCIDTRVQDGDFDFGDIFVRMLVQEPAKFTELGNPICGCGIAGRRSVSLCLV